MKSTANGAVSKAEDAVGNAGGRIAGFASKARTPLMAGGAAVAALAGGLAIRGRSKSRKTRLRRPSLPKVDLDALTSAGKRIREIGLQVGDIADATEKTRKKHD